MLPEEIGAYCADELRGFLIKHGLADTAVAGELVAMTSQALKHNPRRVKQFVNNLERGTQLIDRREGMLSGAWGLAGTPSSWAKNLVDERLKELEEQGGAEVQSTAARLREQNRRGAGARR